MMRADHHSERHSGPDLEQNQGHSLFKLPSFWLAILMPLVMALWVGYFITLDADLTLALNHKGLVFAAGYFQLPLLILALTIPGVALVVANHRSRQLVWQMQLQRRQTRFANHYLHVGQFNDHIKDELIKRLGINGRVLHKVFYPHTQAGDMRINEPLLDFIHHKFTDIMQASQLAITLCGSQDSDEKAVAKNRVGYVMTQSVALMYFIARQVRGQNPECMDFYFLKDAMADYFDVINEVICFDGISDGSINLTDFSRLFDVQEVKSWFARNDNFLRLLNQQNEKENELEGEFKIAKKE